DTCLAERFAEHRCEALREGLDLAWDAIALVCFSIDTKQGAERAVPNGEDCSEIFLRGRGHVMTPVQTRRHEEAFDPCELHAEVVVSRHAVHRGERNSWRDNRCRHSNEKQHSLTRNEAHEVLEHVSACCCEAVEVE